MSVTPISAALLVQVALDAAGSGATAWEKLKAILDRARTSATGLGFDANVLDELVQAPFNVSTAQAISAQIAEQAADSSAFRDELTSWAQTVWQARSAAPLYDEPDGTAIGAAIALHHDVEPRFAVFGMGDVMAGDDMASVSSHS
ncbi:hypothetical protein ACIHCV_38565 [Streptomyces sp. NPDC051956]|uniref:hypothetical protein n=1 Tax=Streptomyces sp. NPDC051956 TaxID=3365677 RepID=UPI0037D3BA76